MKNIEDLFNKLHSCPELSGQEKVTKKVLMNFIYDNTTLEVIDLDAGFYAVHRENETNKSSIALRADYDALALPEGGAAHLCGHDGHATALCGVALAIEGQKLGRNVFLLFQSAEETGAGARQCLSIFDKESIDEIYGAHNLPGFKLGQVMTRPGTFACGSGGYIVRFTGKATHAAYPENGISPANAVGRFLNILPELSDQSLYNGMVLCTVIGATMGEKAFGAAAADAELWLTLRAEQEKELNILRDKVISAAKSIAHDERLEIVTGEQDIFPATENDNDCAREILEVCNGELLETPMRWSEDFGYYLMKCKGAFFGIGAGTEHAALHTSDYEYPLELLEPTIKAFVSILNK